MSKLLILYGFNTYFNRTIKKFSTYNDYKTFALDHIYLELSNTNFDISDGVYAKHVINATKLDPAYNKNPNYVIAEDNDGNLSRWFVLEAIKQRGGQYELSLKRDVIADYYDLIKVAPAFIQKGSLDVESPLIFNNEGMQFNQIKKKEILLKDKTETAWIVGYIARHGATDVETSWEDETIEGESPFPDSQQFIDFDLLPSVIKNNIDSDKVFNGINDNFVLDIKSFAAAAEGEYEVEHAIVYRANILNGRKQWFKKKTSIGTAFTAYLYRSNNPTGEIKDYFDINELIAKIIQISQYNDGAIYEGLDFQDYDGKYIKKEVEGHTKYYKLHINKVGVLNFEHHINRGNLYNNALSQYVNSLYHETLNTNAAITDDYAYTKGTFNRYSLTLEEVELYKITTTIPSTRKVLKDSPYDMFVIPYNNSKTTVIIDGTEFECNGNLALPMATAIKAKISSACYDVQLLPYCPLKDLEVDSEGHLVLDSDDLDKRFSYIKNSADQEVSIILFPDYSGNTFDIDLNEEELQLAENMLEKKIKSETQVVRFNSPNFASSFDVNSQKNEGIQTVNVDFDYKPYSPYIHVAPIFKGLYGEDFNDARGLICGGDFSISLIDSQWSTYQLNNKTYDLAFNRQIENMDVNNSIAMTKAKYTAVLGTISAGITGAAVGYGIGKDIGGAQGGLIGAGIGAVTATTLSGIGAAKDIELLGKQQSENRDYAVDMYTYNLQNIQALPYTLSKVSTFNENNKIFPFIEIYDCTDVEKQNLRDKIKYNGMTVMVQGKIEDFIVNSGDYIQAQLIRIDDFDDDSHVLVEIYNELMKGVYIYGE